MRSLTSASIARDSAMMPISSVKTSTALCANLGSEVSYDESLGVIVLTKLMLYAICYVVSYAYEMCCVNAYVYL